MEPLSPSTSGVERVRRAYEARVARITQSMLTISGAGEPKWNSSLYLWDLVVSGPDGRVLKFFKKHPRASLRGVYQTVWKRLEYTTRVDARGIIGTNLTF